MGSGAWSSKDWKEYTRSKGYTDHSTVRDMYHAVTIKESMNPKNISFRESCDSEEHPESIPIILGLDVTGSMGRVLETVAKKLNLLITEIYNRRPVKDPQVMIMAFGDVEYDRYPLQVSQFESDIRIAEQLHEIYFERGGGGNSGESYTLPWYFAARHTKLDSYEKRKKKGYLFTIGDEPYLNILSRKAVERFIGDKISEDLSANELLIEVSRQYEVYHLMIEEGDGMYADRAENVITSWIDLLGQRAVRVSDCTKLPEIIVSILELEEGKEAGKIIKSWDKSTALVVQNAIHGLDSLKANDDFIEF